MDGLIQNSSAKLIVRKEFQDVTTNLESHRNYLQTQIRVIPISNTEQAAIWIAKCVDIKIVTKTFGRISFSVLEENNRNCSFLHFPDFQCGCFAESGKHPIKQFIASLPIALLWENCNQHGASCKKHCIPKWINGNADA